MFQPPKSASYLAQKTLSQEKKNQGKLLLQNDKSCLLVFTCMCSYTHELAHAHTEHTQCLIKYLCALWPTHWYTEFITIAYTHYQLRSSIQMTGTKQTGSLPFLPIFHLANSRYGHLLIILWTNHHDSQALVMNVVIEIWLPGYFFVRRDGVNILTSNLNFQQKHIATVGKRPFLQSKRMRQ